MLVEEQEGEEEPQDEEQEGEEEKKAQDESFNPPRRRVPVGLGVELVALRLAVVSDGAEAAGLDGFREVDR